MNWIREKERTSGEPAGPAGHHVTLGRRHRRRPLPAGTGARDARSGAMRCRRRERTSAARRVIPTAAAAVHQHAVVYPRPPPPPRIDETDRSAYAAHRRRAAHTRPPGPAHPPTVVARPPPCGQPARREAPRRRPKDIYHPTRAEPKALHRRWNISGETPLRPLSLPPRPPE